MKLSKFLGLLLVLLAIFVFVGCGDKGIILLEISSRNPTYEGFTIDLTCTYADLRSWDEVQTISVHNKTTGKIISSVEAKPCEFTISDINTDFTWVPDGEKEKIYEFYVQMGDKVSNTVSVTIRHAAELLCYPLQTDLYYEDVLNASYDGIVHSMPFSYYSVGFEVEKNFPSSVNAAGLELKDDAKLYRYLKLENEPSFTETEITLTNCKDSLYDVFDESKIGNKYQIYYVYPEENIKTDIVSFELTESQY